MEENNHKFIGEKYKLFYFDKEIPGQVLFLPKGNTMMVLLEKIIRNIMIENQYREIRSGTFGSSTIWCRTKHISKYGENIFQLDNNYMLKPMNCPMHIKIASKLYANKSILPYKLFEINHCYRKEPTGALCGMLRLNRFTQDDSHTIIEINQAKEEIENFISSVKELYSQFHLNNIKFRLSVIEQKNYIGTEYQKITSENILKEVLESNNIEYYTENDGAFYAPKIDVIVKDIYNREWQTGTVQIDMCLLDNMDFNFQNQHKKENICTIHRAMLGTFERFLAIILENTNGIPNIINPYQLAVIFINEKESNIQIYEQLINSIINTDTQTVDIIHDKHLKAKILQQHNLQYVYKTVIGDNEIKKQVFKIQNNKTKVCKSFNYGEIITLNF